MCINRYYLDVLFPIYLVCIKGIYTLGMHIVVDTYIMLSFLSVDHFTGVTPCSLGLRGPLIEAVWHLQFSWHPYRCVSYNVVCSIYIILERALRALASSSGGAACPGATRGQPWGSTPGVRGWFQGDLSEKKNLWRKYERTNERMDGQTWRWK